ncbi:restriction endonuclease subunit S [Aeromonas salmonicida]|uniref:restriction endonuclease subunit S n=1 Tax=Aeromonas bivalvium TaxID=440079 RepID=UPI0038D14114
MAEQIMQETADKAIPAGYKQTEVGLIPEDWALVTIDDVASFSGGSQPAKNFFSSEPKDGYIRLIQIRDYKTSEYETYIPAYLARKLCSEHDIMIGRYGPPIFQILRGISGTYNVALIKTEPKRLIDREYLFYILKTNRLFLLMDMLSQRSSGQTGIELPALKAYPIPLPSKQEQIAISNVLSDIDALTAGLERLITKKQSVKTATMQQLLTGRTRLPQFALRPDGTPKGYKSSELGQIPEDWEVLAIDDCATKVGSGKTPNGGASVYIDAGRPFVRSQNIGWGRLILDDVAYISDDIHNTFSGSEIKEDDVLLNITGASIGRCAITEEYIVGGNVNQHVCIIRLNSVLLNARLLVELINSRNGQKQIDSYQAGGNREGLNFQQVRQLKFAVSNSSVEQTAIATILSDMDNELTALEQKLAKARDLKQGMMQQLLTGRIRLPLPKEA